MECDFCRVIGIQHEGKHQTNPRRAATVLLLDAVWWWCRREGKCFWSGSAIMVWSSQSHYRVFTHDEYHSTNSHINKCCWIDSANLWITSANTMFLGGTGLLLKSDYIIFSWSLQWGTLQPMHYVHVSTRHDNTMFHPAFHWKKIHIESKINSKKVHKTTPHPSKKHQETILIRWFETIFADPIPELHRQARSFALVAAAHDGRSPGIAAFIGAGTVSQKSGFLLFLLDLLEMYLADFLNFLCSPRSF